MLEGPPKHGQGATEHPKREREPTGARRVESGRYRETLRNRNPGVVVVGNLPESRAMEGEAERQREGKQKRRVPEESAALAR
jgi:hypothetical protein